jgi:hypothetical protein
MKLKKKFSSETIEPISTKLSIQGSFHQSLVAIGPVVSEEKIFM